MERGGFLATSSSEDQTPGVFDNQEGQCWQTEIPCSPVCSYARRSVSKEALPMHEILVYADSLSWGIIPDTRSRFRFDQRWPGVVELELQQAGIPVRLNSPKGLIYERE